MCLSGAASLSDLCPKHTQLCECFLIFTVRGTVITFCFSTLYSSPSFLTSSSLTMLAFWVLQLIHSELGSLFLTGAVQKKTFPSSLPYPPSPLTPPPFASGFWPCLEVPSVSESLAAPLWGSFWVSELGFVFKITGLSSQDPSFSESLAWGFQNFSFSRPLICCLKAPCLQSHWLGVSWGPLLSGRAQVFRASSALESLAGGLLEHLSFGIIANS